MGARIGGSFVLSWRGMFDCAFCILLMDVLFYFVLGYWAIACMASISLALVCVYFLLIVCSDV